MKKAITWFLVGVILGNLLLVYANTGEAGKQCSGGILTSKSEMGYIVEGPFNWTPRPVITELPDEIVLKIEHTNPVLLKEATHIGTIVSERTGKRVSLFASNDETTKVWYVEWDGHSKEILRVGLIKFKLLSNSTNQTSKYVGWALGKKVKLIETTHVEKFKATEPRTLGDLYIVTAWKSYEWYLENPITGEESLTAKTVAKGKFYIDYGNKILSINDLSYDWRDTGVVRCSFKHWTDGVGSPSGAVYVDAYYLIPTIPFGIHFDSHPRVFVDAWTHVSGDAWGSKSLGRPWCP